MCIGPIASKPGSGRCATGTDRLCESAPHQTMVKVNKFLPHSRLAQFMVKRKKDDVTKQVSS